MFRLLALLTCLATPLIAAEVPRADGRTTPFREYVRTAEQCPPLAVLSPGFGGTERGLAPLARLLADRGFRVIVMGHRESGPEQLRAALAAADRRAAIAAGAGDPAAHKARFLDLDAVWAEATGRCRPAFALLAGHSMGAQTAMMEAGALARIGRMGRDRFDAYVALSPQGVGLRFAPGAWSRITRPVLMVTGTKDRGVDGDWTTRLTAFEGLPPGRKRLAVIDGGSHMNMGGRGGGPAPDLVLTVIADWLDDLAEGNPGAPVEHQGLTLRLK